MAGPEQTLLAISVVQSILAVQVVLSQGQSERFQRAEAAFVQERKQGLVEVSELVETNSQSPRDLYSTNKQSFNKERHTNV